jgi:hypothetical protein
MSATTETIAKLVRKATGVSRPPDAEQQQLTEARAELERVRPPQDALVAAAQAAFEATPDDAHADALAQAERRREILIEHAEKRIKAAELAVAEARAAKTAARDAELAAVVRSVDVRIGELAVTAMPHVHALIALLSERDGFVKRAIDANAERMLLLGVDGADPVFLGNDISIRLSANALGRAIHAAIGGANADRLREMLEGPGPHLGAAR